MSQQLVYTTKDGDVLDDICWRNYGAGYNVSTLPLVYNANPGLADIGPIYQAGIQILLPALPPGTGTTSVISPWS